MSSILFFDPVCQKPYDTETLRQGATGGTEASVTRVADALGALVMQHNRTVSSGRYLPPQKIAGITHVVLIRDSRALPQVRALFPQARAYLWVHHYFPPGSKLFLRLLATTQILREMAVTLVCVSHDHRRQLEGTLPLLGLRNRVATHTIYNPVDAELLPDGTAVDADKLVFFSSPNKGLKFTLDAFGELRRRLPGVRLVVGNPGYKIRQFPPLPGVQYLAPQPQRAIHAEVRSALCLFYPNFVYPETFGLVFAESKALGTPVLTHDCGAAAEVIADPGQLLPVTLAHRLYEGVCGPLASRVRQGPAWLAACAGLFDAYVERVAVWRAGARPAPVPDPRFRLPAVAAEWRALLSS